MRRNNTTPRNSAGFSADGRRFVLRDVRLIDSADADLWNDTMTLQIDHRGRVRQSGFLQPNMTSYSEPLRAFYVKDEKTGFLWSAPHEPVQVDPDSFEFSVGLADLQWTVENDGIRVDLRLLIPRDDNVELWTATVTNASRRRRRLSFYPYLPCGILGFLAQQAHYDPALSAAVHSYFPYYVKYQDYFALRKLTNQVFCAADVRPDSYELSIGDFVGQGNLSRPDQILAGRLGCPRTPPELANERTASIFQYRLDLAPGGSRTINFVFGPAKDRAEMTRLRRKYLSPGGIERTLGKAHRFIEAHSPSVRVETPDADFNHFLNHWLPRRTLLLARTLRHSMAPQGRNVIQDAMGGAYTDPASSRKWFTRIWAHQHTNGWLPHGMPFAEGVVQIAINAIPHKDINTWGPAALTFYMAETGDYSILKEKIAFADRPGRNATLFRHVCLGLEWLLRDRTRRGLCRIGQGDWNDPLNMAGCRERGESVWMTEALSVALDSWAQVAAFVGDAGRATRYRREAASCRRAVNRYAWNGRWYTRGFTDAGKPFGTPSDREGKVFINSQSWALISGAADRRRTAACIRAIDQYLMTPVGPMVLAPPFTRMREDIGKLTQKVPGTGENGSVYCHAATFLAYALYTRREKDRAFTMLRTLLPGHGANTLPRCGQLPLYIPNFYRGTAAGRKAGLSSHSPNTGTAPWYYRTAVAMLLGVRAEFGGLRIDPQLPRQWSRARVWRRWRGAEFDIIIRRGTGRSAPRVLLDGRELDDNLIPPQPPGTRHQVVVR